MTSTKIPLKKKNIVDIQLYENKLTILTDDNAYIFELDSFTKNILKNRINHELK